MLSYAPDWRYFGGLETGPVARSFKDLVEIVQDLNDHEIGFKSVTEAIDKTSSGVPASVPHFWWIGGV